LIVVIDGLNEGENSISYCEQVVYSIWAHWPVQLSQVYVELLDLDINHKSSGHEEAYTKYFYN
jgi:hypothetical protein